MKLNEKKLRSWIRQRLTEARYYQRKGHKAGHADAWKQGDPLEFKHSAEDSRAMSWDDEINPDEEDFDDEEEYEKIRDQVGSDYDDDDIEDPYDAMQSGSMALTLDELVDTNIVPSVTTASGMDAWINRNILEPLKIQVVSPEIFEEVSKFRQSSAVKKAFQEVLDVALPVYIESATEVLGQDASRMPELSDPDFIGSDGMLEEFFYAHSFMKPLVRQIKKGKDAKEAIKSVKDRWKYMNITDKASQFITGVMTPMFEFLLADIPKVTK